MSARHPRRGREPPREAPAAGPRAAFGIIREAPAASPRAALGITARHPAAGPRACPRNVREAPAAGTSARPAVKTPRRSRAGAALAKFVKVFAPHPGAEQLLARWKRLAAGDDAPEAPKRRARDDDDDPSDDELARPAGRRPRPVAAVRSGTTAAAFSRRADFGFCSCPSTPAFQLVVLDLLYPSRGRPFERTTPAAFQLACWSWICSVLREDDASVPTGLLVLDLLCPSRGRRRRPNAIESGLPLAERGRRPQVRGRGRGGRACARKPRARARASAGARARARARGEEAVGPGGREQAGTHAPGLHELGFLSIGRCFNCVTSYSRRRS